MQMDFRKKRIFPVCIAGAAFLFQLWRGFAQDSGSGGRNEPYVVIASALMTGLLVWAAVQVVFTLGSKLGKK